MSHVLTLIASPGSEDLLVKVAEEVCGSLDAARAPYWLAPGQACDISFRPASDAALHNARAVVERVAGTLPVDWAIQSVEGRRKMLLVADMDSTIIQQECLDEIAKLAGIGAQISAITERAMRGELDFEAALRERVGLLRGFPLSRLQHVLDTSITLTPGARELISTMRSHGARCILVSGGFTFFTAAVALRAGFNAHFGNSFLIEGDAIVGVADPILGKEAKLAVLKSEAQGEGIGLSETLAVGDGANDLDMLKAAGLGVAFHAKPIVASEAAARVSHGDLTSLLFLQGYRQQDFVDRF